MCCFVGTLIQDSPFLLNPDKAVVTTVIMAFIAQGQLQWFKPLQENTLIFLHAIALYSLQRH